MAKNVHQWGLFYVFIFRVTFKAGTSGFSQRMWKKQVFRQNSLLFFYMIFYVWKVVLVTIKCLNQRMIFKYICVFIFFLNNICLHEHNKPKQKWDSMLEKRSEWRLRKTKKNIRIHKYIIINHVYRSFLKWRVNKL